MKKILLILLSCLTAFSLFACNNNSTPPPESPELDGYNTETYVRYLFDTFIQDENGAHRCLWEDGKVVFDDITYNDAYVPVQVQKSAILGLNAEYDLWFGDGLDRCFDFENDWWPLECKYDKTKIEIVSNSEVKNHFILRTLQPCDNEEIAFALTDIDMFEVLTGIRREPADPSRIVHFSITVSVPVTVID